MLLSGLMLKMGLYGILRWMVPIVPDAMIEWGPTAILMSVIGIVYASLIALRQGNFKRLLAYSSMAHVGLISAGIFSLTPQGFQGAMFQMLSHGVNAVALFYIADILEVRMGTLMRSEMGGIASDKNRYFTVLFMVILLGSIALPLTNGFVGEFLLLSGLYDFKPWLAAFGGLTVILGATYMLRSYQDIMLGEREFNSRNFSSLNTNEKLVLTVLAVMVVLMGVYPKPLMDLSQPALEEILSYVKDIY
jgi:NADH-quinone oxidoreductase subunit M